AMAAEWIAQVAAEGWPGLRVAEVQDLRTLAGVVVEAGAVRDIEIAAKASSHSGLGEQIAVVDILDPRRRAPLYRASVRLVEHLEAPSVDVPASLQGGRAMDASEAYQRILSHGERFQLITAIPSVSIEGIDAQVLPSTMQGWLGREGEWLF